MATVDAAVTHSRSNLFEVRNLTILFADMANYSALMGEDEIGTLEFIVDCSNLLADIGASFQGKLVQTTGDGFLMLFERAIDAVNFGLELHRVVAKRQSGNPAPARFRVGIHQGRVHRSGGQYQGHAVNIAARLEAQASPGTCIISQAVYDQVRSLGDCRFVSVGRPALKNIAERLTLYTVVDGAEPRQHHPVEQAGLRLVGAVSIGMATNNLVFSPEQAQAALLGYLALAPGMRESRAKLANLLWPDKPAATALRSLATSIRHLSGKLEAHPNLSVWQQAGQVGLDELNVQTDLSHWLEQLRSGHVADELLQVADWPSQILASVESFSPLFRVWLKVARANWRTRILGGLSKLLERDDPVEESCLHAALAIIAIEPGNEAASMAAIRYHVAHGNRAAALEEHDRVSRYLGDNYGLKPAAAIEELIGKVRSGEEQTRQTSQLEPRSKVRSTKKSRLLRLAVEPFAGAADIHQHLVQGFRSELVANLARFREWSVLDINRPLSQQEQDSLADLARGCHYTLRANCLAAGDVPVVKVQLIEPEDRRIIWSDDIQIDLNTWLWQQRDLVARIAAHLETYISADRLNNLISTDGDTLTTHDVWLRAEHIFANWTPESAAQATSLLEVLVEEDASFAPAYSSLASFSNVQHIISPGLPSLKQIREKASNLARTAAEIDPLDARNHLAVAWSAALTDAFERAAIHLDMAASLNPNNPTTLISCAMGYAFIGQADRGESLVAHSLRIAPVLVDYQWCYVSAVHFLSGRLDEAVRTARLSGDRIIDNQGWIAAALSRLGRREEARQAFEALIEAVRPVWAGDDPPTAEAVYEWMCGSYPLKQTEDRQMLADALLDAMRGQ